MPESEVTVTIDFEPWFSVLTKNLGDSLAKTVAEGMPPEIAVEIMEDALRMVIPKAMKTTGVVNS